MPQRGPSRRHVTSSTYTPTTKKLKTVPLVLLLCGCAAIEQERAIDLMVSEARRAQAAGDRATWAEALRRAVVQRREYRAVEELREPLDGELARFGEDLRKRV